MSSNIDHADFLVRPQSKVDLKKFDPAFTAHFKGKDDAKETLRENLEQLAALQDILYADQKFAVLIILQGMDTAGKDGVIRHVMSGVSPQGINVFSFKQPTAQELSHDYLWRCGTVLPERGRIAIFNRSYYEELAVVRVHKALLAREHLSADSNVWDERYEDIVAFERHLTRNGTLIMKFFLHLSKNEQRKRLIERIDCPEKNWKISTADMHERAFWDHYQRAYEKMLSHTSIEEAPWYIIPADRKWFTRAAVADVIVTHLKALRLAYPGTTPAQKLALAEDRKQLMDEQNEHDGLAEQDKHKNTSHTDEA